ncbi:tail protein [Thioclava dalianensis]|uniref:Tail protein n=1 Tax=Thioclava dalianensis TaxID=1185766 RepID=A0A074TD60_9RHOB|nr:tail protein X [Thioclava dalianensis]KEP69639.1 tail protein [Thioclava dalianensis]SFN16408.1 P2-like prophage tail protein X [Thioclava dalianensis]
MASTYITATGDALDLICLRAYGVQAGAVAQVLEANPEIADIAHRLPAGVEIILPDLAVQDQARQPVRLWD